MLAAGGSASLPSPLLRPVWAGLATARPTPPVQGGACTVLQHLPSISDSEANKGKLIHTRLFRCTLSKYTDAFKSHYDSVEATREV